MIARLSWLLLISFSLMAGDVHIAQSRTAVSTAASGTQDFTVNWQDGGTRTPKAAMCIATAGITDGVEAAHALWGWGFATGAANEFIGTYSSKDNAGTGDENRRNNDTDCLRVPLTTGGPDGAMEFDSFIADGVRLKITNSFSKAYLSTLIFFGGDDLQAHSGTVTLSGTVDTPIDVTAPGFEPHIVFIGGLINLNALGTALSNTNVNLGIVVNDGANTQRNVTQYVRDGRTTSTAFARFQTARCGYLGTGGTWVETLSVLVDNFDANGFDITPKVAGGAVIVGYLALRFDDRKFSLETVDLPTSGNLVSTALGAIPQFVMMGLTRLASADTLTTDATASTFGLSTITADNEFCNHIRTRDGVGTTVAKSLSDDIAISMLDHTGAAAFTGTGPSGLGLFNANGFTIDLTAQEATARKAWALSIEEAAAVVAVTKARRSRGGMVVNPGRLLVR